MTLVVLDVVGLTPRLLRHTPALRSVADTGFQARLTPSFPAVTCSVQAGMLTGADPAEHGIVGNGWYFRDLGEPLLWRQHNRLVGGDLFWDALRRERPGATVANVCWWYAMGAATDWTVTPRPIYRADGRKDPDFYARPPELHDELTRRLGDFPLFHYWGPTASIKSTQWIVAAAGRILMAHRPDVLLVYVPHLDYDLQRYGPGDPRVIAAAGEVDRAVRPLIEACRARGDDLLCVSEYGITPASRPVHVNRALRAAGLLEVHTQDGMEYLDPWASRAFAVADHQIAHIYVADPADLSRARAAIAELDGVDEVHGAEGKEKLRIDHARAGDLIAVADPDAWFTYYYWQREDRAPDFARTVEIHRKPGYDPMELFFDPADPTAARIRAAKALARKKAGLRYRMDVVGLDASAVRGSHGRLPDSADDGPVLLCSRPEFEREGFAASDVKGLMLGLASRR
ncbi:nucleotide pyrophosphatase/phosphodiesterase family protein [Catenulispora rubra]|uniref:nucleotide pyrophosphatase/phosphodiesterase family protein n=1 Tax=Catenulispora rubra TaxID=280293 RepID=UPI0018920ED9|nr:nucleotide pyrophosphatase/phosphodiesterase family protein [Catenulispora rubra]